MSQSDRLRKPDLKKHLYDERNFTCHVEGYYTPTSNFDDEARIMSSTRAVRN